MGGQTSRISRIEFGESVWEVRTELGGGEGGYSLLSDRAGSNSEGGGAEGGYSLMSEIVATISEGGGGEGGMGETVGLGVWE